MCVCVQMLQEIARQKNSQPLPSIKPYGGPRLLPDRYCLTAPNFRLRSSKKVIFSITILAVSVCGFEFTSSATRIWNTDNMSAVSECRTRGIHQLNLFLRHKGSFTDLVLIPSFPKCDDIRAMLHMDVTQCTTQVNSPNWSLIMILLYNYIWVN